jgi:hypothetical protein
MSNLYLLLSLGLIHCFHCTASSRKELPRRSSSGIDKIPAHHPSPSVTALLLGPIAIAAVVGIYHQIPKSHAQVLLPLLLFLLLGPGRGCGEWLKVVAVDILG